MVYLSFSEPILAEKIYGLRAVFTSLHFSEPVLKIEIVIYYFHLEFHFAVIYGKSALHVLKIKEHLMQLTSAKPMHVCLKTHLGFSCGSKCW